MGPDRPLFSQGSSRTLKPIQEMAHVCIIGAGVIGLTAAYYCNQRGHSVTVVDRNAEKRDGCSYGNAGMVVPSHFMPLAAPGMVALGLKWMWNPESPFYIKPRLDLDLLGWAYRFWRSATPQHVQRCAPLLRDLSFASRAAFEEISALPGNDFGLTKRGLLMLCRSAHALDDEANTASRARELGIPAEVLDARQAAAIDPTVTMDIQGAVYFPQDCHLAPDRFMAALQSQLQASGTHFHWGTNVTGWRQEGGRLRAIQSTSKAGSETEIAADEFVLCGGSWSPELGRALGVTLPMQAGKGYSLTLRTPRELPQLCSIFTEARVAVTPMGSRLRFGGTMEIAGQDERINPVRVRGIIKSVSKYFPQFTEADFEGIQPWVGLRPCSPDGMPYIGRTRHCPNLIVATGHAMMGLSLGPVTGKLVAEILCGETPPFDLAPISPDRFS